MSTLRFASAASLIALSSIVAGCASPQGRAASASSKPNGEVGLATRAFAALAANDIPTAISLAERAVEATPNDASFRALLGNAYFLGGRFASAESAFGDSLALSANQPKIVLKLALAQIGQGKLGAAGATLDANRGLLDSSDYGLALVLDGRPTEAIPVLEYAARTPGADAQVRQNLALAYAFSGDWTRARMVASQDVPAGQLDGRIQAWMQLSGQTKPNEQLAALTGIAPFAGDPGQPVRLALNSGGTRVAQAVAPAPVAAPQVAQVAVAAPVQTIAPPPPDPQRIAASATVSMAAATAPEAPAAFAAFAPTVEAPKPAKPAKLHKASVTVKLPAARPAAVRTGKANAVVQLGAYGSPQRVAAAWSAAARKYSSLSGFTPMSARFDSPKGTVYRLSVKGFASLGEANSLCNTLRRSGGTCFVRHVAGDAPVQIASR